MKEKIAWVLLIVLIILILGISYIKFFVGDNTLIEEKPVNNEMSEVVKTALTDIVKNFNDNERILQYKNEGIDINAVFNENTNTIFISYKKDSTSTYEFTFDNLNLVIAVANNEVSLEMFKKIEEILIYAIQKRLNVEDDITGIVKDYIDGNRELDMITTEEKEDVIVYHFNITKKIVEATEMTTNENNLPENDTENNLDDNDVADDNDTENLDDESDE